MNVYLNVCERVFAVLSKDLPANIFITSAHRKLYLQSTYLLAFTMLFELEYLTIHTTRPLKMYGVIEQQKMTRQYSQNR